MTGRNLLWAAGLAALGASMLAIGMGGPGQGPSGAGRDVIQSRSGLEAAGGVAKKSASQVTPRHTPPACRANSLYSAPPHEPTDPWKVGLSSTGYTATGPQGQQFRAPARYEHYALEVPGTIEEVTWWGIERRLHVIASNPNQPCEHVGEFRIVFRQALVLTPVAEFEVQPTRTPTGQVYSENGYDYPLYEYHAVLPEPVDLPVGYMAINGRVREFCDFYWMSSPIGDGEHCVVYPDPYITPLGCGAELTQFDATWDPAFCLTGTPAVGGGACCNPATGVCQWASAADCLPPAQFTPDVSCEELPHPCGWQGPVSNRLLYAPAAVDNPRFREEVAELMGQEVGYIEVDYWNAGIGTPSLETLTQYGTVLTWSDKTGYADATAMGDVLAEYANVGGRVILGSGCATYLHGRIMNQCSPVVVTGPGPAPATYAGDGGYLHAGVSTYETAKVDYISVVKPGAVVDGTFDTGTVSVAYMCDACPGLWPCDLDGNGIVDIDGDFFGKFYPAFDSHAGDANWLAEADSDGDGHITMVDFQAWYQCWQQSQAGGTPPGGLGKVFYVAGLASPAKDLTGDWARLVANITLMDSCATLGACCDLATGTCTSDIPYADCTAPLHWTPGVTCEQLDPPCSVPGCCCDELTGTVTVEQAWTCAGRFLQGVEGGECHPDAWYRPCGLYGVQVCPLDPWTAPPPNPMCGHNMTPQPQDSRPISGTFVWDIPSWLPEAPGTIGIDHFLAHYRVVDDPGWEHQFGHGYVGDVYFSYDASARLTLPTGVTAFYFYLYPTVQDFCATEVYVDITINGGVTLDSFTVPVRGGSTLHDAVFVGVYGPMIREVSISTTTNGLVPQDSFSIGDMAMSAD